MACSRHTHVFWCFLLTAQSFRIPEESKVQHTFLNGSLRQIWCRYWPAVLAVLLTSCVSRWLEVWLLAVKHRHVFMLMSFCVPIWGTWRKWLLHTCPWFLDESTDALQWTCGAVFSWRTKEVVWFHPWGGLWDGNKQFFLKYGTMLIVMEMSD